MKGQTYPLELVTTKVGGMKAAFQDYCFEFHFNRSGNKFWRCLSHGNGCLAKIMSKGSFVYAINMKHNHESDAISLVNTTELVATKTISTSVEPEAIAATIKQPASFKQSPMPNADSLKEKMRQRFAVLGKKLQKP